MTRNAQKWPTVCMKVTYRSPQLWTSPTETTSSCLQQERLLRGVLYRNVGKQDIRRTMPVLKSVNALGLDPQAVLCKEYTL